MFCSNCSQEVITGSRFCHKCGSEVGEMKNKSVADQTKIPGPRANACAKRPVQSALTFNDFRKRKELSRSSQFKSKKKKDEMVKITVGVMGVQKGELKSKRGKRLPVIVSVNASSKDIIQAAVAKHQNHDRKFYVPKGPDDFTLLYPDGSEVKFIPGTETEFKLCDYKNDLGKSYPRIILFICRNIDLMMAHVSTKIESDESCGSANEDDIQDDSSHSSLRCGHNTISVNSSINTGMCAEKPSTSGIGVQCPTCFKYFTSGQIAQHADECVDNYAPFMAVCDDEDNAQAVDSDSETSFDDNYQHGDLKQRIKSEIGSLANRFVSVEQVRLSVRRKNIWDDLKKAARKRIGPTNNLKIVFLGEPAIDDGGPKREFFSGEGYVLKNMKSEFCAW